MHPNLTTTEHKVLEVLLKGSLNKEISAEMNIAINTVKKHNNSIYKKLGVRNRSEAILWFVNKQNNEDKI